GGRAGQPHTDAKEAQCAAREAEGRFPPLPIAASGSGRAVDQPDAARLGELLCGRALQRVLQLHQRLGGKEGPAPHAAGSETQGCWTRWSRPWLYDTLKLFNSYRVRRPEPKVAPAG